MSKKKFLALIPARGGYKGIPGKNIKKLAGKPLIAYTIEAALKAKGVDRVIVSTDDPKIARVARKYGAEVPFMRPKSAARDSSGALAVLEHALGWLEKNESYEPDAVVYLQPTSPLRTAEHITEAVKKYTRDVKAGTLVSVMPVPHNFMPQKLMKTKGKYLDSYMTGHGTKKLSRKGLPTLYVRNGPAILITTSLAIKKGSLYDSRVLPYLMDDGVTHIDIDEPVDLDLAEFFLKRRKK